MGTTPITQPRRTPPDHMLVSEDPVRCMCGQTYDSVQVWSSHVDLVYMYQLDQAKDWFKARIPALLIGALLGFGMGWWFV